MKSFVCVLARRLALVALVALLAACPRHTRKTLVPDVPHTGNADARTRFQEARAKFLRDGRGGEEFDRIAEDFPGDPIVPWAKLYAGIAAVKDRKYDAAAESLKQVLDADVPEGLAQRAQLFLGITKNYQGDAAGALPLLKKGSRAIENDAEQLEYAAAVAYATSVVDPIASLPYFDQLYARVTPTERAVIVARCEEVAGALTADQLKRVFDQLDDRKGPAMAAVSTRLAIVYEQSGNAAEAQRMRENAAVPRAAVGLPRTIAGAGVVAGGPGTPGLLGAVVPLGGNQNKVAEAALAGLGLAAGVSGGPGAAAVEIRAATDASASALAVEELTKKNVVAVIGPIDAASVDAAGGRAESLSIPLLSLAVRPEERMTGRFVFHMRHSAEARARTLARRAIALGIKSFAVLAPEDKYGKSVSAAFVDEVGKGGGTVVTNITYPPETKSFPGFAKKLEGKWDALFVPEEASRLALIAPAVSATGRIPKPAGTKKTSGGRPILLLSTAEGLSGNFLADAGRHSQGALLAPGYYPDDQDPGQKPFLDKFLATYGRPPGVNEAYAYDAAQLAAAAGSGGRTGLAAMLASGQLSGLTGTIKFDTDHRRADPGVIYTVVDESGVFAIRVAK
ncbi:MAG TPA: penicillin-binding protein activator [Kofleriaceae bacterium]|nr:penicillin-binding protein activator [Kofleriaceae bacterium]